MFCVVSMLSKLPPVVCLRGGGGGGGATGLLNKGGGSNRLPVEFPQVQTSVYYINSQREMICVHVHQFPYSSYSNTGS